MNAKFYLLPAIALVLAGLWITPQRQSISKLRVATRSLQKHLAAARSTSLATDPSPATVMKEKPPLDWKKIALQLVEGKLGSGDNQALRRLEIRLESMSATELTAALDEVPALDLLAEPLAALEQKLIQLLVNRDPEVALTRYIDLFSRDSGRMSGYFSYAMEAWAEKDSAKASAWFDLQIAAGRFDSLSLDGISKTRNEFEGALIGVLLGSDPATAARRLSAMAVDQRAKVMEQGFVQQLEEKNQMAFATLVRSQLLEKEQGQLFAKQAHKLMNTEGQEAVTRFLDRIAATPAERAACIGQPAP